MRLVTSPLSANLPAPVRGHVPRFDVDVLDGFAITARSCNRFSLADKNGSMATGESVSMAGAAPASFTGEAGRM